MKNNIKELVCYTLLGLAFGLITLGLNGILLVGICQLVMSIFVIVNRKEKKQ